jgi:hypothetical protein
LVIHLILFLRTVYCNLLSIDQLCTDVSLVPILHGLCALSCNCWWSDKMLSLTVLHMGSFDL